ncbi:MAG: HAMP domain-containing histidine kinase [Clostridia bacterium]|nr:HAMP domain-containing histidine kinase [Clostridia bacterium]
MLSKLRRRFMVDTMIVALVLLTGAVALLIVATHTYEKNNANEMMRDFLKAVTADTVHVEKGAVSVDADALEFRDDVALLLLSEEGEVLLLESPNKTFQKELEEDLEQTRKELRLTPDATGLTLNKSLRYLKQPLKGVGTKVALMDRTSELKQIYFQTRIYAVLSFIMLVLILVLCDFMARRSILPVDEAIRNQQQFIADASHELKTPLTVMLANLDIMAASPDATIRESAKWVENTKQEAGRMSKLVNEMLFLARSDAAMDMHYNFRLIDLAEVANEVTLAAEALAFERNIRLETDIRSPAQVVGDAERLKQVIMILGENAAKYVDEGGTVRLTVNDTSHRTVLLTVFNTGRPIPPEKAPHIFDRFYRVDESRVREQGGYGLGLSIAQKIVQKHNGEIALAYSDERGTCFSVKLPHAQSLRAPDLSAQPDSE